MVFVGTKLFNSTARILRPVYRPLRNRKTYKNIDHEIMSRLNLSRHDLDGCIILDLGANRGDFSNWALRQGAIVIGIEPDRDIFKKLNSRLKRNDNFFPLNLAVSSSTNFQKLYFHKNRNQDPIGFSISSSLLKEKENVDENLSEIILTFDLESFLRDINFYLVKIDIEGSEREIWPIIEKNFKNINFLLLEIHKTNPIEFTIKIKDFIVDKNLQDRWKIDWI